MENVQLLEKAEWFRAYWYLFYGNNKKFTKSNALKL